MNSETAFIVGIGHDEQEYTVNGVRYTVASRYVPVDYHRDDQQTLPNACATISAATLQICQPLWKKVC